MDGTVNTEYRGYIANTDGVDGATYSIGRTSDTGPGDVGREIVNPPEGVIDNPGFPEASRVEYHPNPLGKRMDVILEGTPEGRERVGAFYVKATRGGESVKITMIKKATHGIDLFNITTIV